MPRAKEVGTWVNPLGHAGCISMHVSTQAEDAGHVKCLHNLQDQACEAWMCAGARPGRMHGLVASSGHTVLGSTYYAIVHTACMRARGM